MALRFVDGFDHYSTAQIGRKWTTSTGSPTISAGNGRFGSQSFRMVGINGIWGLTKTLDAQPTWVVGFAFSTSTLPSAVSLVRFMDAGTNQCDLRLNIDGTLSVTRNGTALTGGTSVTALASGTWYYIEWKVTIANSIAADSCQVRLNGVQIINVATGQDTQNTANATANQLYLGSHAGPSPNPTWDYDDLYLCDGTGSVNNDFLGDVRVEALYPSGAGTTTQFTPSAGSNFQCVDETPANDDTDYVSSSTAGQKDTYAFGNLSSTPSSIKGVQTVLTARKDDGGTRTIAPVVRSGGTDYDGTSVNVGDSYACHLQVYETNPDTSAAWTASEVDGAEFGVKLVA